MPKIVSVANCKLAEIGFDKYFSNIYGTKYCDDNNFNLLHTLLWAIALPCSDKEKLSALIAKLIKHCKNCSPVRYKEPITEYNTDYTSWYQSQSYIDCLNQELINSGFISAISPLVDLCATLNIEINHFQLCGNIAIQLSQSAIDCSLVPSINLQTVVNCPLETIINLQATCSSVNPEIELKNNCDMELLLSQLITNNILSNL